MEHDSRFHPPHDAPTTSYRGRFAPTPSGPLHLGSLVAALGSFLDARAAGGSWLLRIEDVDRPRVAAGSVEAICHGLRAHGLIWDEALQYQSDRDAAYEQALTRLWRAGCVYRCRCTRRELMATARLGPAGPVYPGHCRDRTVAATERHALRFPGQAEPLCFMDRRLGEQCVAVPRDLGDFVIRRSDGLFAYHLAVVVDDADSGITDVVRGEDLLAATPAHLQLQSALGLPHPRYLHLPLAMGEDGRKLSKQNGAEGLRDRQAVANLERAAALLGLPALDEGSLEDRLSAWATVWPFRS